MRTLLRTHRFLLSYAEAKSDQYVVGAHIHIYQYLIIIVYMFTHTTTLPMHLYVSVYVCVPHARSLMKVVLCVNIHIYVCM